MPIKYQKFGLRRDKNLSDLSSPRTALANLLDQTVTTTPTFSFVPEDLTSSIDGLRNTTITASDIQKTKGTVREYTNASNAAVAFQPLQTVEDNIRNFKTYLGNPPYAGGGDGIDALFVPWAAMSTSNVNWLTLTETQKKNFRGDQIYDTTYTAPNKIQPGLEGPFDFWDNGIFLFGSRLFDGVKGRPFTDTYGLVLWEGFVGGGQRFDMDFTGLLKIEIDAQNDGNWTFIKNIYNETRADINIASATYDSSTDTSTLTLTTADDTIYINIDDKVTLDGDDDLYYVTGINVQNGTFTVNGDATTDNNPGGGGSANSFPLNADFYFEIGSNQIVRTGEGCKVPNASTGGLVKIRIALYFPNYGDGRRFSEKRFSDFNEDGTDRIPYSNFYKEIPTGEPGIYTYEYFDKNRLSKRNKFISPTNVAGYTATTTTALQTGKMIFANYIPPETTGSRFISNGTATHLGGGKYVCVANFTVSPGDWIVVEGFISGARRYASFAIIDTSEDIDERTEFYVDEDEHASFLSSASFTGNQFVHVYKAQGLIGFLKLTNSSSSTQFTLANLEGTRLSDATMTNDVRTNYMVSAYSVAMDASGNISSPSNAFTHYKKVTKTGTGITTSNIYSGDSYTPPSSGTWIASVYSHTGLQDLSTEASCGGTLGQEVVSSNTSSVTLVSVDGVTVDHYAQFGNTSGNLTYTSSYIPDGVKVQSISGNTVTFDSTITPIPQNATVVFIKDTNWAANTAKEYCILPLNTAPPFIGTDAGLRTSSSSAPQSDAANYPNFVAEGLVFSEAEFTDVVLSSATVASGGNKLDLTANPQYSKTVNIEYAGTTYKFLVA